MRYGTGYQTVWEIRPSAETHSSVHWRRFYFQLTCVHSTLELFGQCALQIYLLTHRAPVWKYITCVPLKFRRHFKKIGRPYSKFVNNKLRFVSAILNIYIAQTNSHREMVVPFTNNIGLKRVYRYHASLLHIGLRRLHCVSYTD